MPRGDELQFGPGGSAGGDEAGDSVHPEVSHASIRPRRLGRGGPRPSGPERSRAAGFNSAPAARPGGTPLKICRLDAPARLQFGPGGSAGGDRHALYGKVPGRTLQFGPGGSAGGDEEKKDKRSHFHELQFGPGGSAGGDAALTRWDALSEEASIRPRRLGRGGRRTGRNPIRWRYGFNSAPAARPGGTPSIQS